MTTQPDPASFTADSFIAWATQQPLGRFELVRGEVVAMAPERAGHARAGARTHRALQDAILGPGSVARPFPTG